MILSAVPIWMNEVTPPRNRGMLVDIHGAALLFGYMLAAWVGNGFFYLDSAKAWRAPLGMTLLQNLRMHLLTCGVSFPMSSSTDRSGWPTVHARKSQIPPYPR